MPLLQDFLNDSLAENRTLRVNGASFALFWMDSESDATWTLENPRATVTIPSSILTRLGVQRAVAVAASAEPDVAKPRGPFSALLDVKLFDAKGTLLPVHDADEPLLLTMPVNVSQDVTCGFWDVAADQWALDGVRDVLPKYGLDGPLACAVTHLTLFAALWKGFVMAFLCAQLNLLSLEALRELVRGQWFREPVALLFWALLLFLALLLTAACCLDCQRVRRGDSWDDAFFLIPIGKGESEASVVLEEEGGESAPHRCSSLPSWLTAPCAFCRETVLKDAVDDIASRWFKYFGEFRSFAEGMWEELRGSSSSGEHGGGHKFQKFLRVLVGALMTSSARRQAGASMAMGYDDIAFLTEDEDLGDLLLQAASIPADGPWTKPQRRILAWRKVHGRVLDNFDKHWYDVHWCTLPCAFLRLLIVGNPFTAAFLNGFMSSSMKVLFVAVELCGSLMVVTVFFEAAGMAPSKGVSIRCVEDDDGLWEEMGRIVGIAVGAQIVAGLPVVILSSLRTRSFKKFPLEDCPEWRRQLLIWRTQDVLVWALGLLYMTLCALFVALFLANLSPIEMPTWGASGGLSLFEDTLLLPMATAIIVPLTAIGTVSLVTCVLGSKGELLRSERTRLQGGDGNWAPFLASV